MKDQAEALRRMAHEETVGPKARVITIASGKGGVGKTTLAVNLAICLSRLQLRTGLLDADLGLANIDIVLGIHPTYHLGHVLSGEKRLEQIVTPGPEGVHVFAGGSGIYELANLSQWLLQRFIRDIESLDTRLDLLVLDTGAGISRNVMSFVLASHEVVVVTTPDLTAITDAYRLIKLAMANNPAVNVRVVVNMVRDENQAQHVMRSLTSVVRQFLTEDVPVELIGYIPVDPTVSKALAEQTPLVLGYPNCKAAIAINDIAHTLIARRPAAAGGIGGLFQRLATTMRRVGRRREGS